MAVVVLLIVSTVACGSGEKEADALAQGHDSHDHGSHDHDHDHESGPGIPLDELSDPPSVGINVEADGAGGVVVSAAVTGITLVLAESPTDHRTGEGHLHVLVDGTTVAMTADTTIHLEELVDGQHEVAVRLSANDHRDYLLDGSPIGDMATVMVVGGREPVEPDHEFAVEVAGGTVVDGAPRFEASIGDLVEVVVKSDVDEEVHLHTYDVSVAVPAGGWATLRVQVTIPGVFEAELHGSGLEVFELQVS